MKSTYLVKVTGYQINFLAPWLKGNPIIGHGSSLLVKYKGSKYLATNYHVISFAPDYHSVTAVLRTSSSEMEYQVSVLAIWKNVDLALLSAPNNEMDTDENCFELDEERLTVQDLADQMKASVTIYGYPVEEDFVVTSGKISGFKDTLLGLGMLQLDASINGGNSGGPVVNSHTEKLVGIVQSGAAELQGFNFAIPAWKLAVFLEWYWDFLQNKKKGEEHFEHSTRNLGLFLQPAHEIPEDDMDMFDGESDNGSADSEHKMKFGGLFVYRETPAFSPMVDIKHGSIVRLFKVKSKTREIYFRITKDGKMMSVSPPNGTGGSKSKKGKRAVEENDKFVDVSIGELMQMLRPDDDVSFLLEVPVEGAGAGGKGSRKTKFKEVTRSAKKLVRNGHILYTNTLVDDVKYLVVLGMVIMYLDDMHYKMEVVPCKYGSHWAVGKKMLFIPAILTDSYVKKNILLHPSYFLVKINNKEVNTLEEVVTEISKSGNHVVFTMDSGEVVNYNKREMFLHDLNLQRIYEYPLEFLQLFYPKELKDYMQLMEKEKKELTR